MKYCLNLCLIPHNLSLMFSTPFRTQNQHLPVYLLRRRRWLDSVCRGLGIGNGGFGCFPTCIGNRARIGGGIVNDIFLRSVLGLPFCWFSLPTNQHYYLAKIFLTRTRAWKLLFGSDHNAFCFFEGSWNRSQAVLFCT